MSRRVAVTVAIATLVAWALPSTAGAHSLVRPAGELVSYLSADATSLNTLMVRPSGSRIEFYDGTVDGGMDPGNCTPGQLNDQGYIIQTFCPAAGVRRVRVDLGEREDQATVSVNLPTTLLGGSGADRLSGGPAGDELSGGEGNDAAAGGPGADVLAGGQGLDALDGGSGADRIESADGVADTVRCGEGADTVRADTVDRVEPDCESVTRTHTAPPADGGADDGKPPVVDVGALTLQPLGRARVVRVYATSSERGTLSASGSIESAGLALPIKRVGRKRVPVAGAGVVLRYRVKGRHLRLARRGLRRGRPVVIRVGVVGTDLTGRSRRRDAPAIRLTGASGPTRGARARAAHPEPNDVDGDEVLNEVDNCPYDKNGSQLDSDHDGPGDACDPDDDNDGVPDGEDNCRLDANPGQEDVDGDGYGDACPPVDSDGDGLIDDDDNCDTNPDPNQSDIDGDDKGDVCDRDKDGDDLDNGFDNCPTVYNPPENYDVNGDGKVNYLDQADRDHDGIGTLCDADEATIDPPGGGGGGDRSPPRLRVSMPRRQRLAAARAGLIVRVRCSEACATTAELSVSRAQARRLGLRNSRVVASGSARLRGAGTTFVFVRFERRARRPLFRRRRLRAALTTVAVDDADNARRAARRVQLLGH